MTQCYLKYHAAAHSKEEKALSELIHRVSTSMFNYRGKFVELSDMWKIKGNYGNIARCITLIHFGKDAEELD
jgi:hypothetical protein